MVWPSDSYNDHFRKTPMFRCSEKGVHVDAEFASRTYHVYRTAKGAAGRAHVRPDLRESTIPTQLIGPPDKKGARKTGKLNRRMEAVQADNICLQNDRSRAKLS